MKRNRLLLGFVNPQLFVKPRQADSFFLRILKISQIFTIFNFNFKTKDYKFSICVINHNSKTFVIVHVYMCIFVFFFLFAIICARIGYSEILASRMWLVVRTT